MIEVTAVWVAAAAAGLGVAYRRHRVRMMRVWARRRDEMIAAFWSAPANWEPPPEPPARPTPPPSPVIDFDAVERRLRRPWEDKADVRPDRVPW